MGYYSQRHIIDIVGLAQPDVAPHIAQGDFGYAIRQYEPDLLLLDEPAAGMNPLETRELDELIVRIRDKEGITILLIEHDMKLVMSLSDRIYVVDYGKKIAQGTPEVIKNNPEVIKAYLGEEVDA